MKCSVPQGSKDVEATHPSKKLCIYSYIIYPLHPLTFLSGPSQSMALQRALCPPGITKKPPIEEHAVRPVQPIRPFCMHVNSARKIAARQHHGVWEREFLFDHSDGRFELCEDEAELENGVLTVVLKRLDSNVS